MNEGLRRKISYFRDDHFRRQRKDVSMARHVLVTGGAGYVGSHACKALASAGYTPIAYRTEERRVGKESSCRMASAPYKIPRFPRMKTRVPDILISVHQCGRRTEQY